MAGTLFTASPANRNMSNINNHLTRYVQILSYKLSNNNRVKGGDGEAWRSWISIIDSKIMFFIRFMDFWEISQLSVQ